MLYKKDFVTKPAVILDILSVLCCSIQYSPAMYKCQSVYGTAVGMEKMKIYKFCVAIW